MEPFQAVIFETERFFLREITSEDAVFAFELNNNPEVIKYTGNDPFSSIEEARGFLENYQDYKKYGIGRWGIVSKENGLLMGWCGLKYSPDLDEVDLGFRLFQEYWNQGIASETGKACLHYGFHTKQFSVIVARVMKENAASIHVLKKLGFSDPEDYIFDEEEGLKFTMKREAFTP